MHTLDRITISASVERAFHTAADVERWATILPHYRWVRFRRKDAFGAGLVEMAAVRSFGPLPYPVWWVSEMWLDESAPAVHYRHVEGITTGMDVVWSFRDLGEGGIVVEITHDWEGGPDWPIPGFLRRWIARSIIGPLFIHSVASRTLLGIRAEAERAHPDREAVQQ